MQNRGLFCRFETNQARRTSKENGNGRSACLVLRERREYGILKPQRRIAGRACGWRLLSGTKNIGAKRTVPRPGRNGDPRDLRLEKNAARRAACQLRASKAGRSWKGGARERADGVFFAIGRKKTPEQSGLCSDVVPKVGLEPTRYRYQRILSPSRLPFHHFGISTKMSIP